MSGQCGMRAEPINSEQSALEFLRPAQVAMIDEALAAVGGYGEVHLVVENHRLRFIVTQRSADVLKWQPGSLVGHRAPSRTSAPANGKERGS